MRASIFGAVSLALVAAGCAGSREEDRAMSCAAGDSVACEAAGGRPGTRTCAQTGDAFGLCVAAPCGAVPLTASGMLHTSGSSISLAGAPTSSSLEFVQQASEAGSPYCLGHAVLSAGAGCTLDLEFAAEDGHYGGLSSIVLQVGPECPGFTAVQEGLYVSPPGWAPDWWLGPRETASGAECLADAKFTFADRAIRLLRADGAFLDVNLGDVSFAGDFHVDVSSSPFLQCIVPSCSPGMADGGTGWCVAYGTCAPGFHDGGGGPCVVEGACTRGYGLASDGSCRVWEPTGDMLQERWGAVAFQLPGGDVLVTGGSTSGSVTYAPFRSERYHPASGTWAEAATPSFTHDRGAYVQLADGRVLAVGGFGFYAGASYPEPTAGGTKVAEVYDPSTAEWTEVSGLITGRYDHAATLLADGRVLVTGGSATAGDLPSRLASAEIFDPASNSWTQTGSMAEPRAWHGALLLPDGRVLVAGGVGSLDMSTETWDPVSGEFTLGPIIDHGDYPFPTFTPLADGRFILTKYLEGAVALLDPATMEVRTLTVFPNTSRVSVATLLDGHVLAMGRENAVLLDVDEPLAIPVPLPPRVHDWGTTTTLANGTVLVAGGENSSGAADLWVGQW